MGALIPIYLGEKGALGLGKHSYLPGVVERVHDEPLGTLFRIGPC